MRIKIQDKIDVLLYLPIFKNLLLKVKDRLKYWSASDRFIGPRQSEFFILNQKAEAENDVAYYIYWIANVEIIERSIYSMETIAIV